MVGSVFRNSMVAVVVVLAAAGIVVWRRSVPTQPSELQALTSNTPSYAGTERCAGCHVQAAEAWRLSHHAQAMQQANTSTVLGDFRKGRIEKDHVASAFYFKD